MISSFPQPRLQNLAGSAAFSFTPYQNIFSFPQAVKKVISTPVSFYTGLNFLIGKSALGQLNFDESSATDANGTIYTWLITGFYPGESPEVTDLFEEMENTRHVVVIKDLMGQQRLVGTPDAPLTFNAIFNSGNIPGEARGFTFTFTGTGLNRAPYYQV